MHATVSVSPQVVATIAEEDLERNPESTLTRCTQRFLAMGGTLERYSDEKDTRRVKLLPGATIYPVCSGGWCRSQSLYYFLEKHIGKIQLVAPHAARLGWDPYNERYNRVRNRAKEEVSNDGFVAHFGKDRVLRFGFEHDAQWQQYEAVDSPNGRKAIGKFYNDTYFGPSQATERVYIAFEKNPHVIMHRLCQANTSLKNVKVISIDWKDTMSKPPAHLNTPPRSALTYKLFVDQLSALIDTSAL